MDTINKALQSVKRRLWMSTFLQLLALSLTIAASAMLLLRIGERILGLSINWSPILLSAAIAAFLLALIASFIRWPTTMRAARAIDDSASLGQTTSTAISIRSQQDPWSQTVIASASAKLQGTKGRAASKSVPIQPPRNWLTPCITIALTAALWQLIPEFDALGNAAARESIAKEQQEVIAVRAQVKAQQDELRKDLIKAGLDPNDLFGDNEPDLPDANQTAEQLRRKQVKRLTTLRERLAKQQHNQEAESLSALRDLTQSLRRPGPGPLDELARTMARGDFSSAKQQLENLRKSLAQNSLSPTDREKLHKQLEDLSKQLNKLAKDKDARTKDLSKQLQKLGMNSKSAKDLAANPDSLKRALEAMKNLSPEQREQLLKQAQAAADAMNSAQSLSDAMQSIADAAQLSKPNDSGMSQDLADSISDLAGQLSSLEMSEQDSTALDQAMAKANQSMSGIAGTGGMSDQEWDDLFGDGSMTDWSPGDSSQEGKGSGGAGRGMGNFGPEEEPGMFGKFKRRSPVKTGQGPTIGTKYVYESQVIGESHAEFAEVVKVSEHAAAEALEDNRVPREYHDAVKRYFGRLKQATEAEQASDDSNSEPTTPTTDPKD